MQVWVAANAVNCLILQTLTSIGFREQGKRIRGMILRRTERQQQPAITTSCCEPSVSEEPLAPGVLERFSLAASCHLSDCCSSEWDRLGHIRGAHIWGRSAKQWGEVGYNTVNRWMAPGHETGTSSLTSCEIHGFHLFLLLRRHYLYL